MRLFSEEYIKKLFNLYCKNELDINIEKALEIYLNLKENNAIQLTNYQEETKMLSLLICDKNFQDAKSIKFSNIKINFRLLMNDIPSILQNIVAINDNTILKLCAVLNLCNEFKKCTTIKISKKQAMVLVALWKNCNYYKYIDSENGYNAICSFFKKNEQEIPSTVEYNEILDSLEKLSCIEIRNDVIYLVETLILG